MEWTIELVLIALLAATLAQAIRLERALGVLKRDRASLETLVEGFNASTHQAESGIQRLRAAADGAGRQIETQIARATALREDMADLLDKAERLADRLDAQMRHSAGPSRPGAAGAGSAGAGPQPSAADAGRRAAPNQPVAKPVVPLAAPSGAQPGAPRHPAGFSQAELDLLAALRMAR